MMKCFNKIVLLWLLIFVFNCEKEKDITQDTALEVNLIASNNDIGLDEELIISIALRNADSLFALSFEINYSPDLFDVDTDAIGAGNIFKEPYLVKFVSEGEVSVALGEWGSIQSSVSGIVCSVVFTSKGSGSDVFYISSPHLIKSEGTFIDDFSMLSIESLEVRVGN